MDRKALLDAYIEYRYSKKYQKEVRALDDALDYADEWMVFDYDTRNRFYATAGGSVLERLAVGLWWIGLSVWGLVHARALGR